MTFAEELKQWRGQVYQKNACEVLGVKLSVYQSWECGRHEPGELAKSHLRWLMKPQHYRDTIIKIAAEIEARHSSKTK